MSEAKELPQGWVWTTLGYIRFDKSQGIQPNKFPTQTFELYSVPSYELGTPELLNGADIGSNKQTVEPDTVLLCKINPRINRAWVVGNFSNHRKIASTEWISFSPCREINPYYLRYFLTLDEVKNFLAANASGVGGSLMRINERTIINFKFPLAPLAEQRRIVAAIEQQFTRLDAGIAALRQAQARLKRYRAAVLKAAVEGKLTKDWRAFHPDSEPATMLLQRIQIKRRSRWEADLRAKGKDPAKIHYNEPASPDISNLPELPQGWTWVTVEQLSSLITSGSRGWAEYYSDEGAIFIRAQDIKTDMLNLDTVAYVELPKHAEGLRTRVMINDLLVTITGANVAKTAMVKIELQEAFVSQHVGLIRPIEPNCSAYMYYWIVTPAYGRSVLEKRAYGAGKPGLNLDNLRELVIALPPQLEQDQIVTLLEWRLSVVSEMEVEISSSLKRAERLRQSILREAFAGRLTLHDKQDEPASVLLDYIKKERADKMADINKRGKKVVQQSSNLEQSRFIAFDNFSSNENLLFDIIRKIGRSITPEELFEMSGFDFDQMEEFYIILSDTIQRNLIREIRPNNTEVYLEVINK